MTEPSPAVGAWDKHYAGLAEPEAYGPSPTYLMAAAWVEGCSTVEDWGCGKGWLRTIMADHPGYLGVDGSASPFADVVGDLATRETSCGGVVLRHVLEHCDNWQDVLDNALASATERLCIVLFTPLAKETTVLSREPDYGNVPVISFRLSDLTDRIEAAGGQWESETIASPSIAFYGVETVILVLWPELAVGEKLQKGGNLEDRSKDHGSHGDESRD